MSAEIVHLTPHLIGDGVAIAPEAVLEAAKGEFEMVVVVGETADGDIQVRGTHGAAESVVLLQWASDFLVRNRTLRGARPTPD